MKLEKKNKRVEKSDISTYPTRPRNRYSNRHYQNDNTEYLDRVTGAKAPPPQGGLYHSFIFNSIYERKKEINQKYSGTHWLDYHVYLDCCRFDNYGVLGKL